MIDNIEDNRNAIILLRRFKKKYNLSWKEAAKVFGRKVWNIENWYQNKFDIPKAYRLLIRIYIENPKIFEKYRDISFAKSIRYDNEKAITNLLRFKAKYKLTGSEVGEVFGRKALIVQQWARRYRHIPTPCKILTSIFIKKPRIFREYSLTTTKSWSNTEDFVTYIFDYLYLCYWQITLLQSLPLLLRIL